MTFATLRQTVLQQGALNPAFFAETASLTTRASGKSQDLTVKVTHRQTGPQGVGLRQAGPIQKTTVDEMEQVEVLFSRDPTFAGGGLARKPDPGDEIRRAPEADADKRPFMFAGEVVFEGDQHAVYVFQRPRRYVGGTR